MVKRFPLIVQHLYFRTIRVVIYWNSCHLGNTNFIPAIILSGLFPITFLLSVKISLQRLTLLSSLCAIFCNVSFALTVYVLDVGLVVPLLTTGGLPVGLVGALGFVTSTFLPNFRNSYSFSAMLKYTSPGSPARSKS